MNGDRTAIAPCFPHTGLLLCPNSQILFYGTWYTYTHVHIHVCKHTYILMAQRKLTPDNGAVFREVFTWPDEMMTTEYEDGNVDKIECNNSSLFTRGEYSRVMNCLIYHFTHTFLCRLLQPKQKHPPYFHTNTHTWCVGSSTLHVCTSANQLRVTPFYIRTLLIICNQSMGLGGVWGLYLCCLVYLHNEK